MRGDDPGNPIYVSRVKTPGCLAVLSIGFWLIIFVAIAFVYPLIGIPILVLMGAVIYWTLRSRQAQSGTSGAPAPVSPAAVQDSAALGAQLATLTEEYRAGRMSLEDYNRLHADLMSGSQNPSDPTPTVEP